MSNRFVTSFRLTALVIAASIVPANACETCTFFSQATDRTGAHRLIVAPDSRTSAAGDTPLVTVAIVNHGRKEMSVDTARILRHMTLHIASANGNARSQFDLPSTRVVGIAFRPDRY